MLKKIYSAFTDTYHFIKNFKSTLNYVHFNTGKPDLDKYLADLHMQIQKGNLSPQLKEEAEKIIADLTALHTKEKPCH